MVLPPTELPCTGTLTTFEPITRLDNATCRLNAPSDLGTN